MGRWQGIAILTNFIRESGGKKRETVHGRECSDKKNRRFKNIQQLVFAGRHRPDY